MSQQLSLKVTPEHLAQAAAARLDAFLAQFTQESRSFLKDQIERGSIRVNGQAVTKCSAKIRSGDAIEGQWILPSPTVPLTPIAADLDIVFEDSDLLVLNKAQGVVVHPAPSHSGETLVHHLLHHLDSAEEDAKDGAMDRAGIVHRLDKGTSGLLLVAKNRHVQEALANAFKERRVKKTYEALTWGKLPAQGRFESIIGRDHNNRLKQSSHTRAGRAAVTDWRAQWNSQHFTLVSLFPTTGRTHQLRVHLSEAGFPIVGDPLYFKGPSPLNIRTLSPELTALIVSLPGTLLHAARLEFTHPTLGTALCLSAPRPPLFDHALERVKQLDTPR